MFNLSRRSFVFFFVSSYALLALAWIFLSDQLLSSLVDKAAITRLSTAKGVFFVLASAAMFFLALRAVPSTDASDNTSFLDSMSIGVVKGPRSRWLSYGFAALITFSILILHGYMPLTASERPMMIFFMLPIILSALIGGLGPGLLATAIAALGVNYFIVSPQHLANATPGFMLRWAFLIVNGLAVSSLSALLRNSMTKLEYNRRLLDSVVSGTSDAIFIKDLQGRYTLVNRAAARFVGKTQNELLGLDDYALFDHESASNLVTNDRAILQSGRVQTHEELVQVIDGDALVFLVTKGPIFDANGQVSGLFGISRDISALRRNQDQLIASELALKTAQQLAQVGSWEWNILTDQHTWSEEIYRIYGRDPSLPAAVYPDVKNYFTDASWQQLATTVEQCLHDGLPYECSVELRRPDGERRWITARGEASRDEHGHIYKLSGTVQDITVHKQLQVQLQDSEERLKLVIDATSDGFWDWNLVTGRVYRSPKYYEVIGRKARDDTHDLAFFLNTVHVDDLPVAQRTIAAHLAGDTPQLEFDFRLNAPGETKWMQLRGRTVVRSDDNKPIRVVGTLSDITEKKKAALALSLREQQLARVIDGSDQGYWDWNIQANLFQVSARWETMLGYEPGEVNVSTDNWSNIIHPDDWDNTMSAVQGHLAGELPVFEVEQRCKTKQGKWLWILSRGRIVEWDPNGKPLMMSGTHTDISEQKRLQLTQSEAAVVFDGSYEGIMMVSPAQIITKVNAAFTRITGYSAAEVLGLAPRVLSSDRHDAEFYQELWHSVQTQGFWRGEIWNKRKNGEIYPELLSISVVRDVAGRVQHYIGMFSDISLFKAHEAELDRVAHYDPLTGVPNRLLLADRLKQSILRATRSGKSCAVCFLDLDGFKSINDLYGHAVGDHLLIAIAEKLKSVLRAEDTLARLGGDEFVLLLAEIDVADECAYILDRLLLAVNEAVEVGDLRLLVSASIGVSLYPEDNADPDTLLRHADQAMYMAKEAGKNRYQLFDPESDRKAQTHRKLLESLSHALQAEQFVLYYQPKVDLLDGTIVGVEALIRWLHPERGVLLPVEFLPQLHGSDLESAFSVWVMQAALSQAAQWADAGLIVAISINVSANHLLKASFYNELAHALAQYPKVLPAQLELEILESAALEDIGLAIDILQRCRSLGVQFALDDFGTGYSSLTYLRQLPVDTLKIDQSFVRDMLGDPDDFGIVESVITLAGVFKRQVIAEGVETLEHGAALRRLGCRYVQGFGIAKPMPAADFPLWREQWLRGKVWLQI